MNGLGSLMQGAAPQGPQQGMPQGQQGMPMPPANDPRMAAATDVVTANIPESLQQVVDENKFAQEAMELLQSAGGQAAMNQTPPTPPTVAERVGQKAEEGVAGLLARLSPGIQQQGQQMARAQQRPPMQGQRPPMQGQRPPMQGQRPPMQGQRPPMPQQGMAGMPARNMQGMARGGVIGYAGPDGSQVKPTPGAMPQNVLSSDQIKQDAAMYQQLKAGLAAAKTPEGKARVQMQLDALIRDMGNEHGKVMQYIDSTKGFVHPRSQMAGGGIIGYAGPNGSQVGYDYSKDPNLYAPTEIAQPDDGILQFAQQQMGRDAEAEARAAGERLRELTGAEGLMAQRTKAQKALQSQREARFSPEESKRREWRAGLAGLTERGLGGFGAGRTAEMDKISGEKLSAAEASVADMDKLIGELRELGMGQFEAEKQARDMVEKGVNQGLSTSAAVIDSRSRVKDAAANRATQERGQDMTAETQRYVADKNAGRLTDLVRAIDALKAEAVAAGTSISDAEAMRQYYAMQPSYAGVAQRGVQANMAAREKAIELAQDERSSIMGDMRQRYDAAENPEQLFEERVQYYIRQLGGTTSPASTTTSVDIGGINPVAIQNLKGDPTAQNRAFFDAAFGVGSAAAVLGQ